MSEISCGTRHILMLSRKDGGSTRVWGIGDNASGQLGLTVSGPHTKPVPVPAISRLPVRSVFAGSTYSAAILATGSVVLWGNLTGAVGASPNVIQIPSGCFSGASASRGQVAGGALSGAPIALALGDAALLVLTSDALLYQVQLPDPIDMNADVARHPGASFPVVLTDSAAAASKAAADFALRVSRVTEGSLAGARVASIAANGSEFLAVTASGVVVSWGNTAKEWGSGGGAEWHLQPLGALSQAAVAGMARQHFALHPTPADARHIAHQERWARVQTVLTGGHPSAAASAVASAAGAGAAAASSGDVAPTFTCRSLVASVVADRLDAGASLASIFGGGSVADDVAADPQTLVDSRPDAVLPRELHHLCTWQDRFLALFHNAQVPWALCQTVGISSEGRLAPLDGYVRPLLVQWKQPAALQPHTAGHQAPPALSGGAHGVVPAPPPADASSQPCGSMFLHELLSCFWLQHFAQSANMVAWCGRADAGCTADVLTSARRLSRLGFDLATRFPTLVPEPRIRMTDRGSILLPLQEYGLPHALAVTVPSRHVQAALRDSCVVRMREQRDRHITSWFEGGRHEPVAVNCPRYCAAALTGPQSTALATTVGHTLGEGVPLPSPSRTEGDAAGSPEVLGQAADRHLSLAGIHTDARGAQASSTDFYAPPVSLYDTGFLVAPLQLVDPPQVPVGGASGSPAEGMAPHSPAAHSGSAPQRTLEAGEVAHAAVAPFGADAALASATPHASTSSPARSAGCAAGAWQELHVEERADAAMRLLHQSAVLFSENRWRRSLAAEADTVEGHMHPSGSAPAALEESETTAATRPRKASAAAGAPLPSSHALGRGASASSGERDGDEAESAHPDDADLQVVQEASEVPAGSAGELNPVLAALMASCASGGPQRKPKRAGELTVAFAGPAGPQIARASGTPAEDIALPNASGAATSSSHPQEAAWRSLQALLDRVNARAAAKEKCGPQQLRLRVLVAPGAEGPPSDLAPANESAGRAGGPSPVATPTSLPEDDSAHPRVLSASSVVTATGSSAGGSGVAATTSAPALAPDQLPHVAFDAPLNWWERDPRYSALCEHAYGPGWRAATVAALQTYALCRYARYVRTRGSASTPASTSEGLSLSSVVGTPSGISPADMSDRHAESSGESGSGSGTDAAPVLRPYSHSGALSGGGTATPSSPPGAQLPPASKGRRRAAGRHGRKRAPRAARARARSRAAQDALMHALLLAWQRRGLFARACNRVAPDVLLTVPEGSAAAARGRRPSLPGSSAAASLARSASVDSAYGREAGAEVGCVHLHVLGRRLPAVFGGMVARWERDRAAAAAPATARPVGAVASPALEWVAPGAAASVAVSAYALSPAGGDSGGWRELRTRRIALCDELLGAFTPESARASGAEEHGRSIHPEAHTTTNRHVACDSGTAPSGAAASSADAAAAAAPSAAAGSVPAHTHVYGDAWRRYGGRGLVGDLLRYVYAGTAALTHDNAQALLEAADAYLLPDLKAAAEAYLIDHGVHADSAAGLLELALLRGAPRLEARCVVYAATHGITLPPHLLDAGPAPATVGAAASGRGAFSSGPKPTSAAAAAPAAKPAWGKASPWAKPASAVAPSAPASSFGSVPAADSLVEAAAAPAAARPISNAQSEIDLPSSTAAVAAEPPV